MRRSLPLRLIVCTSLLVSLVVVPVGLAGAGGGAAWRWLNPLPNADNLNAVCMAPGATQVVWAAGNYGSLLKSTDDGATWIEKASGTQESLNDLDFVTPDTGWAVGNAGVIVRVTGGGTCQAQTLNLGQHLDAVDAVDATHAWAVGTGGTVVRTANGTDWAATGAQPTSADLRAVRFVSATEGWVAGENNSIYYTDDAGDTWQAKGTADANFHVWDIAVDGSTIWAVGRNAAYQPLFYVSTDGGTFYAPVPPMTTAQGYLTSVSRIDATHVWVTTSAGEVLTCNGSSWTEQPSPYEYTFLADVSFRSPTTGIIVGGNGSIALTTNSGETWAERIVDPGDSIAAVDFATARIGMAVSGDTALLTTDSGKSWESLDTPSPYSLLDVDMLDVSNGWMVGDAGIIIRFYRDDTGYTFGTIAPPVTTDTLFSVRALDDTHAWACGYNGTVLRTTGVDSWVPATETNTSNILHGIDFFDTEHGIAVGWGGTVIWTNDGGDTWTPGVSGTSTTLTDVDMVSPVVGFAVGNSAAPHPGIHMLKTTDGGATWTPMTPPAGVTWRDLQGVSFADANNGWIVGGQSTILHTTDGGATWTSEQMGDMWLNDVHALSPTMGWAVGLNGTIVTNYVPEMTTVYRFYHLQKGTHFYTRDVDEKHRIIATMQGTYKYEGVGYEYDALGAPDTLHRFFNFRNGTHFYTADPDEYENTRTNLKHTYTYDGPAYNVSRGAVQGRTVWRFYNKRVGSHFYTADPDEKNTVINTLGQYFQYEGEAFFLPE